MCILFYVSFIWLHVYAFAIHSMVPFIPWSIAGVSSNHALPGFLITAPLSVCVPAVLKALAVWIRNQKKKKMNKKDCMMIHGTRVVLVSILLVRWSVTCCQDSCSMVRQRRIAEEYLIFFATCGRRKSGKMQLATELRLQSYGSWLISIGVRRLRAAQSPRKNAGTVASGKNVDLRRPKVPIRTRSFLETGFWLLYPSFVWFVLLSRTKRVFLISTRTRPRS